MSSLNDLVRAGKVLYLGVSETPAWVVAQANTIAKYHGWAQFVAYQGKYTPAERDPVVELLPMCDAMGLGFVPWGLQPWCTKRYRDCSSMPVTAKTDPPNCPEIDEAVIKISREIGCTPRQVVLAWVLRDPRMASVLLSCGSPEDLEDCVKALLVRLTPAQCIALEKAAQIGKPGYPYKYIGYSYQDSPLFGGGGTIAQPTRPYFPPLRK